MLRRNIYRYKKLVSYFYVLYSHVYISVPQSGLFFSKFFFFFKDFSRLLHSSFSNFTESISENFSKIFPQYEQHQFRITSVFSSNFSIIFLESLKIFFSISLKFLQNFLVIFPKFYQNTEQISKSQKLSLKFTLYSAQVILKFIGKSPKIIIFKNSFNVSNFFYVFLRFL